MNRKIAFSAATLMVVFLIGSEVQARGFRGGGGRGGGVSRGAAMRTPSVSRARPAVQPHARPSVSRPNVSRPNIRPPSAGTRPARPGGATRPSVGGRPSAGIRPGAGTRPTKDQLCMFLDPPSTGKQRPSKSPALGAGAAIIGGGAAAEFLKNRQPEGRPEAGVPDRGRPIDKVQRPGTRPERPGAGNRPGQRPGITDRSRPIDRIANREKWLEARQQRLENVRNRWLENHPRWDFWKDHPHWAQWRWNRPYRWATWAAVTSWFPWGWTEPSYYEYGDNIYYEGDTVYYGDEPVCSAEEYAQQAEQIATSAPEIDKNSEWMSLGVFALTQEAEDQEAPDPTLYLQLAVNKQGIIAGTFFDSTTNTTKQIEGMVDKETQRSAWTIAGKKWPVMEAGIANLTQDTVPVLVHFEDGQTQRWLLVRLEEPKEAAAESK